MPRESQRPIDDDDFDDDELADEDVDTIPCPHCNAEIYEEAERCPQCGNYVERYGSRWTTRSAWIVATAAALIAAFIVSLFFPAIW